MKKINIFDIDINYFDILESYKVNNDTMILAEKILKHKSDNFLELCCGHGFISLLYAKKNKNSNLTAVDIDNKKIIYFEKLIQLNNIKNINTINKDIDMFSNITRKKFDLICCNPPYYSYNEGKLPQNIDKLLSKHQILMNDSILFSVVKKLLLKNGKFIFIYPEYKLDYIKKYIKTFNFKFKYEIIHKRFFVGICEY